MNYRIISAVASVALGISFLGAPARAESPPPADKRPTTAPATRPAPKPLSQNVEKGLAWLAKHQLENGAWGQGEESGQMGDAMAKLKETANVADTCMVAMAMVRSGSTPKAGEYRANMEKAVAFLCAQVEESDDNSLFITSLRGTRTQGKLGTHIDTFLAAQVLAEVKDQMPTELAAVRVERALKKVVRKIELNQKEDGRWAQEGWAPALAQAQATKGFNKAANISGLEVDEKVRMKAQEYAQADFDRSEGIAPAGPVGGGAAASAGTVTFSGSAAGGRGAGAGDAGVPLYSRGAQIASMQESANTNEIKREEFKRVLDALTTRPEDRKAAEEMLAKFDKNDEDLAKAQNEVVARLEDQRFIAGFGSNGGEEFLSYLNIGESLFIKGGDDWAKWDTKITDNLNKVQNADGSWTGHHCITGRTFCTAAAINVLTIDRAPVPLAAKIKEAKR